MVNQTPQEPEYEFDWQNPNKKSFEVGRVVSSTFKAILEYQVKFFLLTFIGAGIPMILISLWPLFLGMENGINVYDPDWVETIEWEGIIGLFAMLYAALIAMSVLIAAIMVQMSVNALTGKPVLIRESIGTGLRVFFPLIVMMIIYLIGVMIGMVLLIIPGLLLALGWALVTNIKVIEGGSMTEVFGRSWSLSKGYKRWILLILVIFSILGAVIGLIFQIPVLFFGNSQTALIEGGSTTFWVLNAVASGLSQMVTAALSYVGLTATYLEIRRVREGVTVDSVADVFG